MTKRSFEKLPSSLLEMQRDHQFFELMWKSIAAQVEDKPFVANAVRLSQAPFEAQVIYWLWRFQCEAGSGGMEVFVLDWLGQYAQPIHAALRAVGAFSLVRLLEAAIPLAREGPAEFTRLEDQSWFNFEPNPTYPSLQSIDDEAFPLINGLTGQVATYARANRDRLFE